jgi:hypothetical protein
MAAPTTTWAVFGPDSPASALPGLLAAAKVLGPGGPAPGGGSGGAQAADCFLRFGALSPAQQAACDGVVGSAAAGAGACNLPALRQTTYCACVNNSLQCPGVTSAACANSAFAYQPQKMLSETSACKAAPICVNEIEVEGAQNVVSGIKQTCGAGQGALQAFQASPYLAGLLFVLLVALLVVALVPPTVPPGLAPAPPPAGVFGVGPGEIPPPAL